MYILTFDIEDWFHINDSTWYPASRWLELENRVVANTKDVLSFLQRHQIKATFFVLGWIAEQYPELVKAIADAGHEIGYHSYYHRIPRFQSKSEFETDLLKGTQLIEQITNRKIEYYRAPNFSLQNKWQIDCLMANGITLSSSIKLPMHHNNMKLPNEPFIFTRGNRSIIELPLLSTDLFFIHYSYSGSGYFRFLPKVLLYSLFKNRKYVMMYFHPRDFDATKPQHPKLSYVRNFMNTVGSASTFSKLDHFAGTYNFISVGEALKVIKISDLPAINF